MTGDRERVEKLLQRLDGEWAAFKQSFAGMSAAQLNRAGMAGDWSAKDVLAHVNTWEEEALKYLPLILSGGRPPRYVSYGGIDAFNARMTEEKRRLSATRVLQQLDETHGRLVAFVRDEPSGQFARDGRARRRLRLDSYGHYPQHAAMIREWRQRLPAE